MRAAFVLSGSRGDFQPFLACALELQKAGHAVKCYTANDHCKMAETFGIPSTVICKDMEAFVRGPETLKAMELGDFGAVASKVRDGTMLDEAKTDPEGFIKRLAADFEEFKPDFVLWNGMGLTQIFEAVIEAIPEVPRVQAELQPQVVASNQWRSLGFHRELPDPDTPPILTHLWSRGVQQHQVEEYQKAINEKWSKEEVFKLMDRTDPPEVNFEALFEPQNWLTPLILPYSSSFFPSPQDWPESDNLLVTGCLRISKDIQDEYTRKGCKYFSVGSEYQLCEEFIAKVGAPVYIGWGSMKVYTKEHMTLLAVEAVKRAGVKAIILSGWAQVGLDGLTGAPNEQELTDWCKENVLFIKAAPHELLFPQCSAAVHHGGIGTLQASVAAACPTIVTPVFSDQFENGRHVANIECGVTTTRLGLLKSDELGDAIKAVVSDPKYKKNVIVKAEGMAKEDGVGTLVAWMTKFYKEELQTGKFKEKRLAHKERLYALRQKNNKLSAAQLQSKFQAALMGRYPALKTWNVNNMKFMGEAMGLAEKGKLWWVQGASVLARSGEGLKTEEVGRFYRFAFVEELAKTGTRIHIKRLKGKGPSQGWVTSSVKGKDMVAQVTDPKDIGRITQMQFDELFADMAPGD